MLHQRDPVAVVIPKWGFSMTEGKVVRWLREIGDAISSDDDLVEIESEKVVNVLGAPETGRLRKQLLLPGEVAPIGALIGVIAGDEISDADIDAFVATHRSAVSTSPAHGDMSAAVPERSVLVDGRRIAFIEAGAGEQTVVFIHGLGGRATSWALNQPAVAAVCRTIAVDLPGHGDSVKDVTNGSPAELAAIVAALLDRLDVASAHLVAHSLGTIVAVELALTQPHRVTSLSLISGLGAGTSFDRDFITRLIEAERRRELTSVLGRLFANDDFVTRDLVQGVLQANRIDGVRDCLRRIVAQSIDAASCQDWTSNLARVSVPVQVLWGRADTIAPVWQLAKAPTGIRVEIIEQVAHMAQVEAAATVNQLLLQQILGRDICCDSENTTA